MEPTTAFLAALLTTLLISAAVTASVWWPLRALLTDMCGTVNRARFWCAYTGVVTMLLPLAAVLFGRPHATDSTGLFLLTDHLQWGLLGLLGALTVAAATIQSYLPRRVPCVFPAPQPNPLDRFVEEANAMRNTG